MQMQTGLSCERVGDEWMVLRDGEVHHLSGPAATVITCVTTGAPIPPECNDAAATLVDIGILTPSAGWSRRKVLTTAAAAAAVGITSATLPTAIAAASPSPETTTTASTTSSSTTTTTASTTTTTVPEPDPDLGVTWADSIGVEAVTYYDVAYGAAGGGVFIAVARGGTGSLVTRSTDGGVSWSTTGMSAIPTATGWEGVATDGAGNWIMVNAVASTPNQVAYSTNNGLSWTEVTSTGTNQWRSVATNGTGTWVAVASNLSNRVMRSTNNGATWTAYGLANGVTEAGWWEVRFGNGVWVAVAISGDVDGNRVMTSPDGITWTARGASDGVEALQWQSVATDGNGTWVAVANTGIARVMRSTDNGTTWTTAGTTGFSNTTSWLGIGYSEGVWVAVAQDGSVATSRNGGVTWTAATPSGTGQFWRGVAGGGGRFVAVAQSATTGERIMYSPAPAPPP